MILSNGKEVYANEDIIGINSNLEVYQGYNGLIDCYRDRDILISDALTDLERIELASILIERWQKYKTFIENNVGM